MPSFSPATYLTHPWVRPITIAYLPQTRTAAIDYALGSLFAWLKSVGCVIEDAPTPATDLLMTTAQFGHTITRDEALLFHAKRKYRMHHRPPLLTVLDIPETDYQHWLAHFKDIAQHPLDAVSHVQYPGLGPQAVEVIALQARRGGPEVALGRFLQSQMVSLRVMALRTENGHPRAATHFDLAGAHPTTAAGDIENFGEEVGLRLLAATCAKEVDLHTYLPEALPQAAWAKLTGPDAMIQAGTAFTRHGFFTDPVRIEKLLGYRGLSEAISAQYSEGCYAVFEPDIPGLVTTATGSSKLVDKRFITRADQAIVVDVKPKRDGAVVRPVEGNEGVRPSVEAMEMMSICQAAGTHLRANSNGNKVTVPNVHAILHGHLGIARYDPTQVESVTLDAPYYRHLVSCGTGALAEGTAAAFGRSASLQDVNDPRLVVFLEQPGHGIMVVEKWDPAQPAKAPFATLHEFLEAGHLAVTLDVPQGAVAWEQASDGHGRTWLQKA